VTQERRPTCVLDGKWDKVGQKQDYNANVERPEKDVLRRSGLKGSENRKRSEGKKTKRWRRTVRRLLVGGGVKA